MRRPFLAAWTACCSILLGASAGATPVNFSGSVSNDGLYGADSLYVVILEVGVDVAILIDFVAVASGTPPNAVDFSIGFDNTGAPDSVLVGAILDVDGSGFDADSLDNSLTGTDVLGWYDGHLDPVFVSTSASQTGLDFALPTAEVRGTVIFAQGQTWADLEACSIPNSWCPYTLKMQAAGSYSFPGLYAGGWKVRGYGPSSEICYGDPTCANPTEITVADGEIRTGIDIDFSAVGAPSGSVTGQSWGRTKSGYR